MDWNDTFKPGTVVVDSAHTTVVVFLTNRDYIIMNDWFNCPRTINCHSVCYRNTWIKPGSWTVIVEGK